MERAVEVEATNRSHARPHIVAETAPYNLRREVSQRYEHETALPHPRVGYPEIREVNYEVADEQYVDVERPRPPPEASFPPSRGLRSPGRLQQIEGCGVSPQFGDRVEVRALSGRAAHGRCLVHRGHRHQAGQVRRARPKVRPAVTQVRTEGEESPALFRRRGATGLGT
jgi:hypothetical protein